MEGEHLFGSLPDGWEYTSLGEACRRGGGNIQTGPFGSQLHASDYVAEGIPSVMPQNIGDNRIEPEGIARITQEDAERLSRYLLRSGDIVYSRRGDVERRALVRELENGWLCGTGCLRVRLGDEGVDPRYASFYLAHPSVREWIVRHAHGATMANLNTSILSACPFVIPTVEDQRGIANVLGVLDDKIELNRQMNRTLEAMARVIFKAWFVDFEPARAKAAGATSFRGMSQAVFDQLPDRFTDTELGPVPEGWKVAPLSDFVELIGGGTPRRKVSEYWDGDIPWFSVRDAPRDGDVWVIDTEEKITKAGVEDSSAKIMRPGTSIISARGTVGRLALTAVPMSMNQSCYGVAGRNGVGDFFVYFTLHHAVVELQQRTHGSVFDTITRKTFDGLERVLPHPEILADFEEAVGPYLLKMRGNLIESRLLADIRDTLLPKLVSGELCVPTADGGADDG